MRKTRTAPAGCIVQETASWLILQAVIGSAAFHSAPILPTPLESILGHILRGIDVLCTVIHHRKS
jgi:hypothetical protein